MINPKFFKQGNGQMYGHWPSAAGLLVLLNIGCRPISNGNDVTNDPNFVGTYRKGERFTTVSPLVMVKMESGLWTVYDVGNPLTPDGDKLNINFDIDFDSRDLIPVPVGSEIEFDRAYWVHKGAFTNVSLLGLLYLEEGRRNVSLDMISEAHKFDGLVRYRFKGPRSRNLQPIEASSSR